MDKKNFQGRCIFCYFIFSLSSLVFFSSLLGLFLKDTISISQRNHVLQVGATPIVLFQNFLDAYWLFIVVGTLVLVLLATIVTNRFCGPIVHLEQTLDTMLAGNLDCEIQLRARDDLQEIVSRLNRFNEVLSENLMTLDRLTGDIHIFLDEIKIKAGRQDAGRDILAEINEIIELNRDVGNIIKMYNPKSN